MTVKELIDKLNQFEQNKQVIICHEDLVSDGHLKNREVNIRDIDVVTNEEVDSYYDISTREPEDKVLNVVMITFITEFNS